MPHAIEASQNGKYAYDVRSGSCTDTDKVFSETNSRSWQCCDPDLDLDFYDQKILKSKEKFGFFLIFLFPS